MIVNGVIPFDEVKTQIVIPNPGGRKYSVKAEESGHKEVQTFTSRIFPKEITLNLIGLKKAKDGSSYPVYITGVTNKYLWLKGQVGFRNASEIINNILKELLKQEGILEVRSVKQEDLKLFKYGIEKHSPYWIDSCSINYLGGYVNYVKKWLNNSFIRDAYLFYNNSNTNDQHYYGMRAVIVLNQKVIIKNNKKIKWVES